MAFTRPKRGIFSLPIEERAHKYPFKTKLLSVICYQKYVKWGSCTRLKENCYLLSVIFLRGGRREVFLCERRFPLRWIFPHISSFLTIEYCLVRALLDVPSAVVFHHRVKRYAIPPLMG